MKLKTLNPSLRQRQQRQLRRLQPTDPSYFITLLGPHFHSQVLLPLHQFKHFNNKHPDLTMIFSESCLLPPLKLLCLKLHNFMSTPTQNLVPLQFGNLPQIHFLSQQPKSHFLPSSNLITFRLQTEDLAVEDPQLIMKPHHLESAAPQEIMPS